MEQGAAAVKLEGMAVAPVAEGAAELDVAETFEPAEVFDEGVPGETRTGESGMGRKLRVRRVPEPAVMRSEPGKGWEGGGGGTMRRSLMRACCQGGMRRGRLAGSAKKAKTSSMG